MAAITVDVRQIDAPATPLLVVRRQAAAADLSRVVPEACGTVWNAVRASGIRSAGRHVALYLSPAIDLEVGVEVGPDGGRGVRDGIVLSSTPPGRAATARHVGAYATLGATHAAIVGWCERHGHALAGVSWEVYGHPTPDPSPGVTDVFYLIR